MVYNPIEISYDEFCRLREKRVFKRFTWPFSQKLTDEICTDLILDEDDIKIYRFDDEDGRDSVYVTLPWMRACYNLL